MTGQPHKLAKLRGIATSVLRHFIHLDERPYSLFDYIWPARSISDIFVWDASYPITVFHAENQYAQILGESVPVLHRIRYFSDQGLYLAEQNVSSDEFSETITLELPSCANLGSFTHHIFPLVDRLSSKAHSVVNQITKTTTLQHRGYTGYMSNKSDSSIPSIVHGNFGGVTDDLRLTARQRSTHIYTPSFCFQQDHSYDLYFTNPTPRNLRFDVSCVNARRDIGFTIAPLGVHRLPISGYSGLLTISANLPIPRAIIFSKRVMQSQLLFDVFHA